MKQFSKREITGWIFYDWANSVYSLVISTAIFPIYYASITSDIDKVNILGSYFSPNELYSYALTLSFLIVAFMAPILSGIADNKGRKKFFMHLFCYLGGLSCMMLYFFDVDHLWIGILFSILANIGFWGSMVFYNGFLPEICPIKYQDKVSAKAYSLGYIGSSILLILNLVMISNHQWFGLYDKATASRVSFVIVGIWWIIFAQFTFHRLRKDKREKTGKNSILSGYRELIDVYKKIAVNTPLKRYLYSFFFFNIGVQTIILLASLFGSDELQLSSSTLILTILIIQFVGVIGAYTFSRLSAMFGNIKGLQIAIFIWVLICIGAYLINKDSPHIELHFFVMAIFVGLVMGGIQTLSRSTYSKLIPQDTEDYATYFSFYDVTEKISIVIGTFSYGFVLSITGSMKLSALVLAVFFIIGFILSLYIPKHKNI